MLPGLGSKVWELTARTMRPGSALPDEAVRAIAYKFEEVKAGSWLEFR